MKIIFRPSEGLAIWQKNFERIAINFINQQK